jgi:hypothetical protein
MQLCEGWFSAMVQKIGRKLPRIFQIELMFNAFIVGKKF